MPYIIKARKFLAQLRNYEKHRMSKYDITVPMKNLKYIADYLGVPIPDLNGSILQVEILAIHINNEWKSLSLKGELKQMENIGNDRNNTR